MRIAVLALVWGSGFLWIKLSLQGGLSPGQITFARAALGSMFLLAICAATKAGLPRGKRIWAHLIVAAFLCNALPFTLFAIGERTVDSGIAGVLNATTPLWSLLLAREFGKTKALLLGFGGVLLIFAPWRQEHVFTLGAQAMLGAAASYAAGFAYMASKLTGRGTQPVALAAAQLLVATALAAVALPFEGAGMPSPTLGGALSVVILGTLGTGLSFLLSYKLIADEGPAAAAIVGYLLPVVSVALGAIFLGEPLNARVITGMLIVLAAVAASRSRPAGTDEPGGRVDPHPVRAFVDRVFGGHRGEAGLLGPFKAAHDRRRGLVRKHIGDVPAEPHHLLDRGDAHLVEPGATHQAGDPAGVGERVGRVVDG